MNKKNEMFDIDIQVSRLNDTVEPNTLHWCAITLSKCLDLCTKPAPQTLLTCNPDPMAPCAVGGQQD